MSEMVIEKMLVRFVAGSEISRSCTEAYNQCLSKKCKEISFDFNGISITMKKSEDER
jgi:hypothetical protein